MMDNADGAEIFSTPDIAWQATPPPPRFPVPARHAPELQPGDEVTIGQPGRYFLDDQVLARTDRETITIPRETQVREAFGIASPLHWWMTKAYPEVGITMQWWPVDYTWTYRDAISSGPGSGLTTPPDGASAGSWLDGIQVSLDEPPARRPRPAREVPALTGRRLRVQHAPGEWSWRVAVSEPVDVDGDICVHVMQPSVWWILQVTYHGEVQEHIETLPIYRLFAYC